MRQARRVGLVYAWVRYDRRKAGSVCTPQRRLCLSRLIPGRPVASLRRVSVDERGFPFSCFPTVTVSPSSFSHFHPSGRGLQSIRPFITAVVLDIVAFDLRGST